MLQRFTKFFGKSAPTQPQTQAQREALLDALVFAMMADSTIAPEEERALAQALEESGWESAQSVEAFVEGSKMRVSAAMGTKESAQSYIEDISARLESAPLREHAYACAARIICADGEVADEERGLMSLYMKAFGLRREVALELLARAHREFELL